MSTKYSVAQVLEFRAAYIARNPSEKKNSSFAEGAFGKLYKGEIEGELVAIKKFKTDKIQTIKHIFEDEKKYLETLAHPNIVRILGHASDGSEFYFIITELLPKSLDKAYKGFEWKKILRVLRQIAGTLRHIHNKELVYYDLKPENVLLTEHDNVKLCDMGSVGKRDKIGDHTPGYYPNELKSGIDVSGKVDIYSFGITCLQLIMKADSEDIGDTRKRSALYRPAHQSKKKAREGKKEKQVDTNIFVTACQIKKQKEHVVHKTLMGDGEGCSEIEAKNITDLAIKCASELPKDRPTIDIVIKDLHTLEVDPETKKKEAALQVLGESSKGEKKGGGGGKKKK